MVAQAVRAFDLTLVVVYLAVVAYLGWLGYRRTRTAADYMLAGRKAHPFIMAMSYGATFISTSAIVGFGGVAAMFGMSLMWLTFLNIFVGVFLAFVFLGEPTRRMGHALDAHTFPEFVGRRLESRFLQVFSGLIIFLFMPVYAAAVIIGGTEFVTSAFRIDYTVALLALSAIVAVYVLAGGLKSVMYTDALQGVIMAVGMLALLVGCYTVLGGVSNGHRELTAMADKAFVGFKAIGQRGWTATPAFGWGKRDYNLWWIVFSTITLGVGIGVLAQPQLIVRFMTVQSRQQLIRGVPTGGIFLLLMVGVAYTVGSLSNAYFYHHEKVVGRLVDEQPSVADVITKKDPEGVKTARCRLLHVDTDGNGLADVHLVAEGVDKDKAIMPVAEIRPLDDGRVEVRPRATSFTRALVRASDGSWMFNSDSIIPTFVTSAMPRWFGVVFLLTLLAAAMSTISSQFHTAGTAIGRDVIQQLWRPGGSAGAGGTHVVRVGMIIGIVMAVTFAYYARGGYIIARATAIFFGLCAAAFLPTFLGCLFFRRLTRAGAIASMAAGFLASGLWLLLVKVPEAGSIGLVQRLTGGKVSLLAGHDNWPVVDPLVIALPISALVAILVSLGTKPPSREHLRKCFGDLSAGGS